MKATNIGERVVFYGVRENDCKAAKAAIVACGAPNAKFHTKHGYTGNITSVFPSETAARDFAEVWNLSL